MNRLLASILLLFVFCVGTLLANVVFSRFDARTEGNNIVVSWQASVESDISEYVLERKTLYDAQFIEMARFQPHGTNSLYTYRDDRVFKVQSEQVSYRLRIINTDNSFVVTDAITIDYTPTAVRRTWGSIKAMFL